MKVNSVPTMNCVILTRDNQFISHVWSGGFQTSYDFSDALFFSVRQAIELAKQMNRPCEVIEFYGTDREDTIFPS